MQSFIDNVNVTLSDELKCTLKPGGRLSIAAASFSIYAYEALKEELEKIDELRFVFTHPAFTKNIAGKTQKEQREFYIPKLNRERNLYGTEFEIKLRNQLSQKAIAKECADGHVYRFHRCHRRNKHKYSFHAHQRFQQDRTWA